MEQSSSGMVAFTIENDSLLIELIPDLPATTRFTVKCSAAILSATLAHTHAKAHAIMVREPRVDGTD